MLRTLRWRLTLLFFMASLGLISLMGAGTYGLIAHYFQQTTDLAMQYRMALEFDNLGLPLPPELANAEKLWLEDHPRSMSLANPNSTTFSAQPTSPAATNTPNAVQPANTPASTPQAAKNDTNKVLLALQGGGGSSNNHLNNSGEESAGSDEGETAGAESESPNPAGSEQDNLQSNNKQKASSDEQDDTSPTATPASIPTRTSTDPTQVRSEDDQYDGDLSAIFVVPQDPATNHAAKSGLPSAPLSLDKAASNRALLMGVDWRTVTLQSGLRARLLTYRISGGSAPPVLQIGRLLIDQDRFLNQYMLGLLIFGGASCLLLALASWWLAGRSLGPAQKSWSQQQNFVSNASHELRTPLTLLRATADCGLRDRPAEPQAKVLQDIVQECDYMDCLVDDLLLLSRLDTQRLEIPRERVALPELLGETVRQMEKIAQEKRVELVVDTAQGVIWGNATRLRQVLLILIDNALRFTPAGGAIHLQTRLAGKKIEILVRDNGSGIAPEHLPRLFDRFYQVRTPQNDNSRSNGLGLSIAKALIEAQHGAIRIESTPGRGTQVTLALPLA